LVNFTDL